MVSSQTDPLSLLTHLVIDVVNFVEDHPFNIRQGRTLLVEFVPEDFCGHNHTLGLRLEHDISSDYSNLLAHRCWGIFGRIRNTFDWKVP